jgi:hypothetical protein
MSTGEAMKVVRLGIFYNGHNPGDVAGFDDALADRMIRNRQAVAYVAPVEKPAPVVTVEQKIVVERAIESAPVALAGSESRPTENRRGWRHKR